MPVFHDNTALIKKKSLFDIPAMAVLSGVDHVLLDLWAKKHMEQNAPPPTPSKIREYFALI